MTLISTLKDSWPTMFLTMMVYTPVSDLSAAGRRSCEAPSVLLMVTLLEMGTPSFSHFTSGHGDALAQLRASVKCSAFLDLSH